MTKLRDLGFTKLAKEETNVSKVKLVKPKIKIPSTDELNAYSGKQHMENLLKSNKPGPPKLHPVTSAVLSSISKDVQTYTSGDKKVWDKKWDKFEKNIKDPKKVLGAGIGAGLYFAGKKHPKLENAVNVIKDRQINFINKKDQRLSLTVPKNKKGHWNLSWSKTF